jgi:hypothetical protein
MPRLSYPLVNALTLTTLLALGLATGCSGAGGADPASDETINIPGVGTAMANGWTKIQSEGGGTKLEVRSTGRFTTSWTPCMKSADGALSQGEWEALANRVNAIIPTAPLPEKYCFPFTPRNRCTFNNQMKVMQESGERTLLEYFWSGEVCTNIADHAQAQALAKTIDQVMWTAAQEDCTLEAKRYCGEE